jgi:tetratricopeptide (TPR) repeat protein
VKEVLKVASVLGRTFFYRILQSILDVQAPLQSHLSYLEQRELIRQKRAHPDLEYFFKHALIQQATYDSILTERRRELHRNVGRCIEGLFRDRLEDFYGVLAYHYTKAEDWKPAQRFLVKAGDQAGKISADAEALAHYEDAIVAYTRAFGDRWDPVERASLERKMGEALFRRGNYLAAAERLITALRLLGRSYPETPAGIRRGVVFELFTQLKHRLWRGSGPAHGGPGGTSDHAAILIRLPWIDYFVDQERFLFDLLLLLNASEDDGHDAGIAVGAAGVGMAASLLHQRLIGRYYLNYAVKHASHSSYPIAVAMAQFCTGCHRQNLDGDLPGAVQALKTAADACEECKDITGWGICNFWIAWIMRLSGRVLDSLALTNRVAQRGEDAGELMAHGYGIFGSGFAYFILGDTDAAVRALTTAVDLFSRVPAYILMMASYACLGRVYLAAGRPEEARPPLQAALNLLQQHAPREYVVAESIVPTIDLHLSDAANWTGASRQAALDEAGRLIRMAWTKARLSREVQIYVARSTGTYWWIRGRRRRAMSWWQTSAAGARALGAFNEEALTYIEMGRRTLDPTYAARAGVLLVNSEAGEYRRQLHMLSAKLGQ